MFRSTTFRFAALVFLLQIAAAAALILGMGALVRRQVAAEAARTVSVLRDDLRATYEAEGPAALAREVAARSDRLVTPRTALLLVGADGRKIAGNLDAWPPSVAAGDGLEEVRLYRSGHGGAEAMRVEAVALPGGERLLAGAVTEGEMRAVRVLEGATGLALSLALIFAAVAAWAAARLIVARLEATRGALEGVAAGDLGRRVPADAATDAFAALGRSVNDALERVETLVTELRVATDGLAHDLKSPLTRLRASLERAGAAVREPAGQEAVDRATGEADRLLAMVQTALSITRAEAGIGRESFVAVDLAAMLADVADIYAPLVEDHGRTIAVDAPRPVEAAVHRELLAQAIGNLVDNSLKYGAGPIVLTLRDERGAAALDVADRGPGIPAARRDEAIRRFGRLDAARSGTGAGLGLSLVAAVAKLHDGTLALSDAEPGLIVRLTLPTGAS